MTDTGIQAVKVGGYHAYFKQSLAVNRDGIPAGAKDHPTMERFTAELVEKFKLKGRG